MSTAAPAAIMPSMLKATLKWALILACLLALGPLMAKLMMQVRDVDGGRAISILINGDLRSALLATAAIAACTLVVGLLAAKLYNFTTASLCAGFIVAWAASSEGSLESIVRRAGNGNDLYTLALEGFVVTVAAGFLSTLLARTATPPPADNTAKGAMALFVRGDTTRDDPKPLIAIGLIAGLIVAAVVVWLIALSGARNQTLAAAICAGIAAGSICHAVSSGRHVTLTPLVPILSLALLALLGPILVKSIEGQKLLAKIYDGTVLNLARPISLDWAAGALIGVPIGLSWTSSSVQRTAAK